MDCHQSRLKPPIGTTSSSAHSMIMTHLPTLAALAFVISAGAAAAEGLRPEAINSASLASIPPERPLKASLEPDPAIVRLQALLDRSGSSPGVIDGFYGENVSKAIAGFEAMRGLAVDDKMGPNIAKLLDDTSPIVERYVVSPEDATGLVDKIPADYGEKAKMPSMGYTSIAEKLSERFHMDIDLLSGLNLGSAFKPGETVNVVMPGPPKEGRVTRIEVRK